MKSLLIQAVAYVETALTISGSQDKLVVVRGNSFTKTNEKMTVSVGWRVRE